MVFNEAYFLPLWCRFYGAQVGFENLYVIDHGSTDGSVDPAMCNRIRIPRDKFDDQTRVEMISSLHESLLTSFDAVIYTDCDEFIVARPTRYGSLRDYLARRGHTTTRCVGVNVVPAESEAPELDLTAPILKQRRFGFSTHWYFKPLISSVPIRWEPGFHDCDVPTVLDPDVWLFHLKFANFRYGLARQDVARNIEWRDPQAAGRVADTAETIAFLRRLQDGAQAEFFETADFQAMFETKTNSPLSRIPEDFAMAF